MQVFIAILMSVFSLVMGAVFVAGKIISLNHINFMKVILYIEMARKKMGLESHGKYIGVKCKCGCGADFL